MNIAMPPFIVEGLINSVGATFGFILGKKKALWQGEDSLPPVFSPMVLCGVLLHFRWIEQSGVLSHDPRDRDVRRFDLPVYCRNHDAGKASKQGRLFQRSTRFLLP